jgi:hypothetical protein
MKRKADKPADEFLPRGIALRRTDDLLRAMLNTPPDPRSAPTSQKKPKKRAKK